MVRGDVVGDLLGDHSSRTREDLRTNGGLLPLPDLLDNLTQLHAKMQALAECVKEGTSLALATGFMGTHVSLMFPIGQATMPQAEYQIRPLRRHNGQNPPQQHYERSQDHEQGTQHFRADLGCHQGQIRPS